MSRKRLISPEFFTHAELFDAERASGLPLRLAFAGLWTASDRRGLFLWRPRELKLLLLPYDDVDFAAVLGALAAAGFIERYVVDGKEYGHIPSFADWQTFHKNEKPSNVPEPSGGGLKSSKLGSNPPVTVTVTSTGTSAVAGAVASARSAADPLEQTIAEAELDMAAFGEYSGNVVGIIRAAKSPIARAQTIASHLPHRGGTSNYSAVGLACREFAAQDNAEFNARYFAAFVERAEKALERNGGRRALKQEARFIDRETMDRENASREDAEATRALDAFRRDHPERYAELEQQAGLAVRGGSPETRAVVLRASLLTLIRRETRAQAVTA